MRLHSPMPVGPFMWLLVVLAALIVGVGYVGSWIARRLRWAGWLGALVALALLAGAFAAFAHGDAGWIMSNKRYVDKDGTHCCGPSDCRREQAAKFREAPEGVYVATGAGVEILMPRSLVGRGLYPSIDDDWWICIRGGVVRCVFKPASGM